MNIQAWYASRAGTARQQENSAHSTARAAHVKLVLAAASFHEATKTARFIVIFVLHSLSAFCSSHTALLCGTVVDTLVCKVCFPILRTAQDYLTWGRRVC